MGEIIAFGIVIAAIISGCMLIAYLRGLGKTMAKGGEPFTDAITRVVVVIPASEKDKVLTALADHGTVEFYENENRRVRLTVST